jgi:predicted nucleic acid-binding protein
VSANGPAGLPRAVLDSNVIFSRVLHELMGRIATGARLLDLVWSDELLAEAKRVLQEKKPMSEEAAERWVSLMREAFPEGRVDPSALQADVDLASLTKDAGDQFVCALAIASGAQFLFTFDRGYLTEALRTFGITVTSPDPWLATAIAEEPDLFEDLLPAQARAWGGRSLDELIDAIERAGAPDFAARARELFALSR